MPLPTSVPETAQDAFNRVLATAQAVSTNLKGVQALIASGAPLAMDNLIGLYQALNAARSVGVSIQGVDGLADHARAALGDASYDIDAAFMASIVACTAVTDWLLANMPGDGRGGFLGWERQSDGTIQRVTVSAAQLAPLSSLIAAALVTFA